MSKSVNRNAEHSRYSTSADSRTGNDTKEACQNSASKFFAKNFLLKKSSPTGKSRLNTLGRRGGVLCARVITHSSVMWAGVWTRYTIRPHAPSTKRTIGCPCIVHIRPLWTRLGVHGRPLMLALRTPTHSTWTPMIRDYCTSTPSSCGHPQYVTWTPMSHFTWLHAQRTMESHAHLAHAHARRFVDTHLGAFCGLPRSWLDVHKVLGVHVIGWASTKSCGRPQAASFTSSLVHLCPRCLPIYVQHTSTQVHV